MNQWIRVSERKPDNWQRVNVAAVDEWGDTFVAVGFLDGGEWVIEDTPEGQDDAPSTVFCWLPLPEPPSPDTQEDE